MNKIALGLWLAAWANLAVAQVAEEYTVTDLSGWTSNQLATLPHFDRYVPLAPAGANFGFVPTARSGLGVVSGTHGANDELGAFVDAGSQTNIAPWGTYGWSYWSCDSRDCHFYSGSVTKSPAQDVNVFGQIVGYATLAGGGDSSQDYETHGYLRDAATGEHLDLTPGAHRADFRGISDHGEITGTSWRTTSTSHAFRRSPDGTLHDFIAPGGSVSPTVINNHGVIAGTVVTHGFPWIYHLFVSTETNAMATLPYPSQGSPENGNIYDINDHGMIVGRVYKAAPVETQAVRWYPDGGGWATDDLNELLADGGGDYIIDSAIAINDAGHIIVRGHEDGVEPIVTHTLLLTPDVFPAPSVVTLDAIQISPTGAVVRAKVNPCNRSTTLEFQHGLDAGYGTTLPISGTFTGTAPALVITELTGLSPHTAYHYRGRGTNAEGTTNGEDMMFTTPYTYAAWAAEQFGTNAANPAVAGENEDPDSDGVVNRVEYAFGGQALVPGAPPSVVSAVDTDDFLLAYTRPTDRSGVVYMVEQAVEMGGPWQAAEVTGTTTNPDGTETVYVRSTIAVSAEPVQFLRVRIY